MMNGGVSGEVSGEVIKKHLTIGKADKQVDLAHFGEVLPPFLAKLFPWPQSSDRDSP